ncbi:hypothetical protein H8B02_22110 [Bradyrhizobium sp. Pear77]|uniref:hypothetical protein n=1 Tax=Bradyrhizobium TaxID=374 RepID=UPI001E4607D7|nr:MULTISPECIES: hypothetical protein [Bradyrhizobium]MCC8956025.1 hypothetical protein [Bradyrhizobium altum]MCC8966467.1 hypothetical protein [Bradyrhizobium oropedii]
MVELDELAKALRTVTMGLDHPLVDKHIHFHNRVMVHSGDVFRGNRSRHFVRRMEKGGRFYVRMGKRGECKRYIERCEVTFIYGEPTLYEYRLSH